MSSDPRPTVDLNAALDTLQRGGVVALPTDTLYALSALATDPDAVRKVYAIKGREDGKPLPLFVTDAAMAARFGEMGPLATALATRFWPGALTVVLKKRDAFNSEALAGGVTVALRAPAHDGVLELLRALDEPITGTSANRSGASDPDTADEVRRQLGDEVDLIIDGGRCAGGVSSTIVDCTGDGVRILRQGAIAESDIHAALTLINR